MEKKMKFDRVWKNPSKNGADIPLGWEAQTAQLKSYGIVAEKLPEEAFDWFKKAVEDINKKRKKEKLETYNEDLAGMIKEEYPLPHIPRYVTDILFPLCYQKSLHLQKYMMDYVQGLVYSNSFVLNAKRPWVNFMKKHEFNPIHNHSGLFSYIIFMDIPYEIEDELEFFPPSSVTPVTSCLQFGTFNKLNNKFSPTQQYVDKSFVGGILIFPADLWHQVYPFYTSNKERITVAGNIHVKPLREEDLKEDLKNE